MPDIKCRKLLLKFFLLGLQLFQECCQLLASLKLLLKFFYVKGVLFSQELGDDLFAVPEIQVIMLLNSTKNQIFALLYVKNQLIMRRKS